MPCTLLYSDLVCSCATSDKICFSIILFTQITQFDRNHNVVHINISLISERTYVVRDKITCSDA